MSKDSGSYIQEQREREGGNMEEWKEGRRRRKRRGRRQMGRSIAGWEGEQAGLEDMLRLSTLNGFKDLK